MSEDTGFLLFSFQVQQTAIAITRENESSLGAWTIFQSISNAWDPTSESCSHAE